MPKVEVPAEPLDLQPLDDFLASERAPDEAMGLSDLDGFLTALAVGPEPIVPSEWLPLVWGGEDPLFEDLDEAQRIISLIMARYNEIVAALRREPPGCAPIFWESGEGEVIASDWAAGFLDAISLRPDGWMPLLEDEEANCLIAPIMVLGTDEDIAAELGVEAEREAELLDEAAAFVPACVIAIDEYWRQAGRAGPAVPSARRHAKPGRNDPCPCGSGKKFKHCCGAS